MSRHEQACTDIQVNQSLSIFSTNVSIKEHKELLCPKRIQCCIYKSTGCPFKGPADTMMSHQASCQYRPGYNIIKCEICGDPIHLPKFSKTKFENHKRCFNCRLVYFEGLVPIWAVLRDESGRSFTLEGHWSFQFIWS